MELIEVSNFKNGRYLLSNMKSDKHAILTDRAYEALKAFKEGNTININLESTQLL